MARLAEAGTEVVELDQVFASDPLSDWFTQWSVFADRTQGHLRGTDDWERIDPGLRQQIDHGHERQRVEFVQAIDSVHRHNLDLVALFAGRRSCCARRWPARRRRSAARGRSTGPRRRSGRRSPAPST